MQFKDHFTGHAELYARARPGYPDALFSYLASIAPDRSRAWDCGTGNGQAAVSLAGYFTLVSASDASSAQISRAPRHDRVSFYVASAENSALPSCSIDLVCAAAAVHWFNLDLFYSEVRRVLKPGGILAVWSYAFPAIDAEIDRVTSRLAHEILGEYWPPENQLVWDHYRNLPFPFEELTPPRIEFTSCWTLTQLCAYLNSWSASQRYQAATGRNPVEEIFDELDRLWGASESERPELERRVQWEAGIRVGRNSTK